MNHLIVLASPNPSSFTTATKDRIVETIEALGQRAVVRDLYADGFSPVLSADDFAHFMRGELPIDVLAAQAELREADVLHLVYPIWWAGMPAMLKGYIDRVFTPGFAYRRRPEDGVLVPLLIGKRATVWNTHGNTRAEYETNGMYDGLNKTSDDGILRYVGIEPVAHRYLAESRSTTEEDRVLWLDEVARTIEEVARMELVVTP